AGISERRPDGGDDHPARPHASGTAWRYRSNFGNAIQEDPKGYGSDRSRVRGGLRFGRQPDRKSTGLNSSHVSIWYAVFCLKKKNIYTRKAIHGSRPDPLTRSPNQCTSISSEPSRHRPLQK